MIRRILYRLMGGTRFARHLGVTVGENCRILTSQFGSEPWLIEIGNKVTISSQVTFINHDGIGWLYADEKGRRFKYAKITIGDNVFIGANSIIMPGVKIGSNCIVGAGSVVTKSIPPGMIVAGNPARRIGSFAELMGRVSSWPSSQDMQGSQYKERVHSILEADYKTSLASVPVSKPQQH